jgi:hypothetical protein
VHATESKSNRRCPLIEDRVKKMIDKRLDVAQTAELEKLLDQAGFLPDALSLEFKQRSPAKKRRMRSQGEPFSDAYQRWYTSAGRFINEIIPERYLDFRELYKSREREPINAQNYDIADFILGLTCIDDARPDSEETIKLRLQQQIRILASLKAVPQK